MTLAADRGLVRGALGLAAVSAALLWAPQAWPAVPLLALWLAVGCVRDYRALDTLTGAVSASVEAPRAVIRAETIGATLLLENSGARDAWVVVRPILPAQGSPAAWSTALALTAGNHVRIDLPVRTTERGEHLFDGVWLRVATRRRYLSRTVKRGEAVVCRVLPDVAHMKEMLISRRVRNFGQPLVRTAAIRGIGNFFESLRDYEQGDDIRRIDWRATAKHRRFITRNYEVEPDRNVVIMVDCGRLMAARAGNGVKLDHAVDSALMLAAIALDSGDRCGLIVFDRTVRAFIPPRAGLAHLPRMVDTLAGVLPSNEESHFLRAFAHMQTRLHKRSLVIVLSDIIDADVSRSMVEAMAILSQRHLVLMAALRTPGVYDTIATPDDRPIGPFRKAIAYSVRRERSQVLARIHRGGALVVDVAPEKLTAPLINHYVRIREQNRL